MGICADSDPFPPFGPFRPLAGEAVATPKYSTDYENRLREEYGVFVGDEVFVYLYETNPYDPIRGTVTEIADCEGSMRFVVETPQGTQSYKVDESFELPEYFSEKCKYDGMYYSITELRRNRIVEVGCIRKDRLS